MADEDNSNNGNQTPTPPAAPAPQPSNGTPAITPEIQALIDQRASEAASKASNAAWAEARRTFEQKQKPGAQPPAPTKPDTQPAAAGNDALAILAMRDAFDDATSDLTLSGSQKKFVRDLVMKERPADVADYVKNFVSMSGWSTKTTPPPASTPAAAPATATPAAPQSPQPAGAPPARVITDDTPIFRMSPADRQALLARIGPFEFKARHLKELSASGQRFTLRR